VDASAAGKRYRSLFISDVHLGMRTCQAEALLDFLRHVEADTLYLVGDIIDFWKVKRGPYWPQAHNDVIQKIQRKVRKGTRVVLVPGNHDDGLRDFYGMQFGGIEVLRQTIHIAADGKRYVVMHGDEFDVVIRAARWMALLGDLGYDFALWLNRPLNWARRHLGFGYWSLAAYLKHRVKKAVSFIGAFEEAIATEAQKHGADGVICGHIHHAADRMIDGVRYLNCGDWVESCTAIAETQAGVMIIIHWRGAQPRASAPAPVLSAAREAA
jgi:UDP-2,3-diacylglucosamine pyrophosphatase LpxH